MKCTIRCKLYKINESANFPRSSHVVEPIDAQVFSKTMMRLSIDLGYFRNGNIFHF